MQALWSRAGQARSSCRCSSCLHASKAVARRTTTATSRRSFKAGDLVTACYSTVIATAVFVDARVKEDRRKEWDRVIAEAKAGLPTTDIAIPQSTHGQEQADIVSSRIKYYRSNIKLRSWKYSTWEAPRVVGRYVPQSANLKRLNRQLQALKDCSVENVSTPGYLASSPPVPDEKWTDEDEVEPEGLGLREPRDINHLDKMSDTIRHLVEQLLLKTGLLSIGKFGLLEPAGTRLGDRQIELVQRVEKLRTGFIYLPAYSWDSMSAIRKQHTSLHKALATLCKKATPNQSNIEMLVSKICYNLLVCTTPPSIDTYNILIREFSRLRQHDLTQSVVDSFFGQSRLRPNETTLKLILEHYIAKRDPQGFQDCINRMRAIDSHMHIESKNLNQLRFPAVREWALTNKVCHRGAYLFQKADRTPTIYQALIKGAFELKGLRPTIRYIKAALRDGHSVSSQTIYRVVEACLARMDYRAGRYLLEALLSAWETGPNSIMEFTADLRLALHQLFALCNIHPDPKLSPRLPRVMSRHRDSLRRLLRWLQVLSIEDSVNRCEHLVSSLREALEKTNAPSREQPRVHGSLDVGSIEDAFVLIDTALFKERRREKNRKLRDVEARAIRLQTLDAELDEVIDCVSNIAGGVESWKTRQTRWNEIQSIEAALVAQADWLTIQEYELAPLLFGQFSDGTWQEFIGRVKKSHSEGVLIRKPFAFISHITARKEKCNAVQAQPLASAEQLSETVDGQAKITDDTIKVPRPSAETFAERLLERPPHQLQLFISSGTALSRPDTSLLSPSSIGNTIEFSEFYGAME